MHIRHTPIHSIPTEILAHIFCYVSDVVFVTPPLLRAQKIPPALLLRSVCHYWRAVAENTPSLWPDLVGPYGLEWTRRAILWSKTHPLEINFCDNEHHSKRIADWEESVPLILTQVHRARDITVACDEIDMIPAIRQALLSPLPRLESLDIRANHDDVLVGTSFAGEVPMKLTELALKMCIVPPVCPVFRAPLTSLKVDDCTIWTSMDDLLRTLTHLPHLEAFDWDLYFWTDDEAFATLPLAASTEPNPRMVHLPRLQSVNIRTRIELITYFFTHVAFPTSCEVVVNADTDIVPPGDIEQLFSPLDFAFGERLRAAFPGDQASGGYRSLTIDGFQLDTTEGVTFLWSKPTADTAPARFHLAFLPLHEGDGHVHPDILSIACHMLNSWPVAHRALLHLRNEHPTFFYIEPESTAPGDQPWAQLLRPLHSVERLETYHIVHGLADALAIREPAVVLPRLRQIEVREAGLSTVELAGFVDALKTYNAASDGNSQRPRPTLRLKDCALDGMPIKMSIG